jgi:hypothetical protein
VANPYIPTRDADLDLWAANFNTLITADPPRYGLVAGDATTIDGVFQTWHAAFVLASDPSTRTIVTVAAKDAAKAAMVPVLRAYAQQIKANLGVTDDDKAALGLNLDDNTQSSVPPPSTQPLIAIIAATPLQHTLRFADANTPDVRARPEGTDGLQLFRAILPAATEDHALGVFDQLVTRQPFASDFLNEDVGKVCTYFARWYNSKGEVGPWSTPISMVVV